MRTLNNKSIWDGAMNYTSYRLMIDQLISEGKTTGPDQSEALINYTDLNAKRMKRIDKTYTPDSSIIHQLKGWSSKVVLLTITESWCGDAAQIVPVISALANEVDISSRFVLRDENLDLIDQHLTNGGRSIPVILVLDANSFEVIASWGPRPSAVQTMVMDYKKLSEPKPAYSEFSKEVQLWYAKDKYKSIEREFSELVINTAASIQ